MRLRPETLATIAREVGSYGVDPKTAEAIVLAVIEWYRKLYVLRLRRSLRGKKLGRPRKMTPAMAATARELRAQGLSYRAIGVRLGVKGHTVWYELLPAAKRKKKMKKNRAAVDRWRAARVVPI